MNTYFEKHLQTAASEKYICLRKILIGKATGCKEVYAEPSQRSMMKLFCEKSSWLELTVLNTTLAESTLNILSNKVCSKNHFKLRVPLEYRS